MSKRNPIFATNDKRLEQNGHIGVPVRRGQKKPHIKEWQKLDEQSAEDRERLRSDHRYDLVGVLVGTPLSTGRNLACLDVDHDGFVSFVETVLSGRVCTKRGAKGLTFFVQAEPGLKNEKLKRKGADVYAVEILAHSSMTVIPPSPHPSGCRYEWVGTPLYEVEHDALPILTEERLDIIQMVATNEHAWAIVEGGA